MAPMTRRFSPGGVPGDNVAAYYAKRAANKVGLIITEGAWIPHAGASDDPNVPRLYGNDALTGWTKVVAAVHAVGGHNIPQLWHVGLAINARLKNLYGEPASYNDRVGPSGIVGGQDTPIVATGQPMTQADIDTVIHAYVTSAAAAQASGFDGVELHAAHDT
jgi:2,4-dienoyl-CoA reductase-like NADH-dependent reductase (Old Yellow Enzyme family)